MTVPTRSGTADTKLNRSLSLPILVLYGLGTTIGAGIYALLGDIAATAGSLAPWSFVLASILAALTACSFSELASRYPNAGATALYVQKGFGSITLARLVGVLLICSAITSCAALVNAMVGYAQVFIPLSRVLCIVLSVTFISLVGIWGIKQSAWFAATISLIEIGGVLWLSGLSVTSITFNEVDWRALVPTAPHWEPVFAGAILSFYAYIGFEDLVEVAEEAKDAKRNLPRAILWTLIVSSILYVVLMTSTQLAVSAEFLATSEAPFADIYQRLTGTEPAAFSAIGLLAILNGALIQVVMASRVIYGLANRQQLPSVFARVNSRTKTPIVATATVGLCVLALSLAGSLGGLAKLTSLIMLTVFGLGNLALWRLKRNATPTDTFTTPRWVPALGALVCIGFVARALWLW